MSEAGEWLVDEEEGGFDGKHHRDLELALLAVAQLARGDVRAVEKPAGGKRAAAALRRSGLATAPRVRREPDAFGGRELGEDIRGLVAAPDAETREPIGRRAGDVLASERDAPGGGPQLAREECQERGFAGAVRTDDRVDGARLDLHRDALPRCEGTEAAGEPFRRENGLRHAIPAEASQVRPVVRARWRWPALRRAR